MDVDNAVGEEYIFEVNNYLNAILSSEGVRENSHPNDHRGRGVASIANANRIQTGTVDPTLQSR